MTDTVIQRGNNRTPCFYAHDDYGLYLHHLAKLASKFECAVHAYVLMTNHVHLLTTGGERGAIPRMMQSVVRRYARYINTSQGRTGTLFEGRFRSIVVDTDRYFLTVMCYIELNPIRAGMVAHPGEYRWSSFRENAGGSPSGLLTAHSVFEELGADRQSRRRAYLSLFDLGIDDETLHEIRLHVNKNRALGSDAFRNSLSARLGGVAGVVVF